ncbi:hypothetical protein C8D88_110209 [Lentzea atacamensis]|uniref:Uncharacterized protein n=2 Tax=Lentzea TaxID=165301 RepID=A0A316HT60_9PSEU|nr:hypothetical protein [Lentzea atacamensis]PWK83753.1 hypothetical protein C8D88_110209 [Lentzea atacamensis]
MLSALGTGLGTKVAERWAGLLGSPALVFWIGGLLAWTWGHGGFAGPNSGWRELERWWARSFGTTSVAVQAFVAVLLLLLVAGSARLGESLIFGVLRLLEGYWPRWARPLRVVMVALRGRVVRRRAERWRAFARRREELTTAERAEYASLNRWRAGVPADPGDRMPTKLGDVLRAAESRSRHRYGLDAVVCWPPLWLAMPDTARAEVSAARTQLDDGARLWLWSLLFCVWTPFTWWALGVALLGMIVGYRVALAGSVPYGRLVQTCYDLYRKDLYAALGHEMPTDPQLEIEAGRRLTAHLERGPGLTSAAGEAG